ncbi:DUF547 domain-containing protein [Fulvivirgaceae bacterium BMA12]|uniref:DUF547 domain-containing protein n=1 Tax=Agaribacillus aureus TaxID=3051825 RepID=A0ABT8L5X7_9BACT|nr:DUF547 domain-containing protein [Fulvivirgaceae bacterium BMA12]
MKKVFTILLSLGLLSAQGQDLNQFYKQVDSFLGKYTKDGRVSYDKINKSLKDVEPIYKQIGEMNLSNASDNEKIAFYINAYNMIVIYQVAKYYPLKSALDQSGFFDKVKHKVAGEMITLNALEIIKLLRNYKDPKFHFVLACAAKGCPKLASYAYYPDKLQEQIDARTKTALNDSRFIRVNDNSNKVNVSMIFKWYIKDFTQNGQSVISFINTYKTNKIPDNYQLDYYPYDWSLNM